jgi:glutamate synthase (NADPH/NADH) large chain
LCFRGVADRIKGARFVDETTKDARGRAWNNLVIQQGSLLKFVYGSEYHAYNGCSDYLASRCAAGQLREVQRNTPLVDTRPCRCCVTSCWKLKLAEQPLSLDQVKLGGILKPLTPPVFLSVPYRLRRYEAIAGR